MRIDFKQLENKGFHVEPHKDSEGNVDEINVYPYHMVDIAEKLQALCGLPIKACYGLQEDIVELQIIEAMKSNY